MKYLDSSATISECGRYRYDLKRVWDWSQPRLLWVMYNPSTADATEDDPTITRVVNFSKSFGAGGVVVCNLFAFRATQPHVLRSAKDPVGPWCDSYLMRHAVESKLVVAAWGALVEVGTRPLLQIRPSRVLRLLDEEVGAAVYHLGLTAGGHPKHPGRIANDAKLVRWERRELCHK